MTTVKIQLKHPEGKNAPAIKKDVYALFEKAIISVLRQQQPLTFSHLAQHVGEYIGKNASFDGSVAWYSVCVKQHLEATGIIGVRMERGKKMHFLN